MILDIFKSRDVIDEEGVINGSTDKIITSYGSTNSSISSRKNERTEKVRSKVVALFMPMIVAILFFTQYLSKSSISDDAALHSSILSNEKITSVKGNKFVTLKETTSSKVSDLSSLKEKATAFRNHLSNNGYTVRDGFMTFFFKEDCELYLNKTGTCYGNNPGTPYGLYQLPHIPGEETIDLVPDYENDGYGLEIRIRSDEAIVLMGITPPKAKYFGYSHYLFRTLDRRGDGNFTAIFASLDDTINPTTINVGRRRKNVPYNTAFEKEVVITTSGNKNTIRDVDKALDHADVPGKIRNLQRISTTHGGVAPPVGLFHAGLEADKDTLTFLHRVAIIEDEAAREKYFNNPPVIIFRITPNDDEKSIKSKLSTSIKDRFPIPLRAPRWSFSERRFENALNDLESAVRVDHNIQAEAEVEKFPLNGNKCILGYLKCLGDNGDTAYFVSRPTFTMPDENSYYVIIGVNHMASGRSQYSEVGALDKATATGVSSFNSVKDMPGSTSIYFDGDDNKYLYALTVRRNCTGIKFCMELPSPPAYPKVDFDEPPIFTFRAVLSPGGSAGPDLDKLLKDRVFFVKAPQN